MDIKELEFIRDFCDKIDDFKENMKSLTLAIDPDCREDEVEGVPFNYSQWMWASYYQLENLIELYIFFKEKIDYKYYDVWKAKYPHMRDKDASDEEVQEQFMKLYKERIKEIEGCQNPTME